MSHYPSPPFTAHTNISLTLGYSINMLSANLFCSPKRQTVRDHPGILEAEVEALDNAGSLSSETESSTGAEVAFDSCGLDDKSKRTFGTNNAVAS